MKIGIFDSGLGGLSILRELIKDLPKYDYVYLGDNARVPYGGRSTELVYKFTKQALDFLFAKNCLLVIIACNTATASALKKIQQEYLPKKYPDRKVLGVIRPAVEAAIEGQYKKVGVIGTHTTINTETFVKELKKLSPQIEVFQQACPLLVPIIEEGELDWEGLNLILDKYFSDLKKEQIDSLILGCTHYGLIEKNIQKTIGKNVKIISEGKEVAKKLKDYFKRHPETEKKLTENKTRQYFVTDLNPRYLQMAKLFLGSQLRPEENLNLVEI